MKIIKVLRRIDKLGKFWNFLKKTFDIYVFFKNLPMPFWNLNLFKYKQKYISKMINKYNFKNAIW